MKDNSVFTTYKELVNDAVEDLKTKGRRHKQIPNVLTLMRLTAPCFIIPAAIIGNVPLVLGLTAFFGLTDLADGFIARKWKLTSELGKALDAITDKVFACTLLLAAAVTNPILLSNLGLETIIAGINVSKKLNGFPVESSYIGKAKTWFLFALAGTGIVSPLLDIQNAINPLMITTTVMQTLTIISYLLPISQIEKLNRNEVRTSTYSSINISNSEEKELKKEKTLETTEVQEKINKDLSVLKEAKEFLISELTVQENNANEKPKVYEKRK